MTVSADSADLPTFLRAATAEAHQSMEDAMDLLGPGVDAGRMRKVLQRFFGFHVVWEVAVGAWPALAGEIAARSRLAQLRADLTALGLSGAEIEALPRCEAAAGLAQTEAAALGSFYVLEGSTLGGKVITKALAARDWLPEGGFAYFDPYGARTGEMWRGFREWLAAHPAGHDQEEVAQGARRTFALLETWMSA